VAVEEPKGRDGEVALREVIEADLPILFEHQCDPEAVRMAAFPSRDRETFDAHWAKLLVNADNRVRTILYGGRVAGHVGAFTRDGVRLAGYWLGREYWGKGITSRAFAQFLEIETARPLQAHVAKHNIGSIRVLEKCGFKVCGEERVPYGPPGEFVDDFIMKLDAEG
jgi:RimJ/RimL family protein N-acetyltransferase